jgi:serine/threonine protein kinase
MLTLAARRYATSLDTVISSSPDGLPLERLERYAAQSMAALHELHRNKVVMLDFKPSNLLLDEAQDAVVVADFGISRITDSINGQLTGSARGAGTPCYM